MLLTGPVALIDNDEADLVHGQVLAPPVEEVQENLGRGDDDVISPELLRPLQNHQDVQICTKQMILVKLLPA